MRILHGPKLKVLLSLMTMQQTIQKFPFIFLMKRKDFTLSQKHAGDVGTMKVLLKRNDVPYEEKEA